MTDGNLSITKNKVMSNDEPNDVALAFTLWMFVAVLILVARSFAG